MTAPTPGSPGAWSPRSMAGGGALGQVVALLSCDTGKVHAVGYARGYRDHPSYVVELPDGGWRTWPADSLRPATVAEQTNAMLDGLRARRHQRAAEDQLHKLRMRIADAFDHDDVPDDDGLVVDIREAIRLSRVGGGGVPAPPPLVRAEHVSGVQPRNPGPRPRCPIDGPRPDPETEPPASDALLQELKAAARPGCPVSLPASTVVALVDELLQRRGQEPGTNGRPSGAEMLAWVNQRFGARGPFMIVAKLAAEAGEALDAAIKHEESRTDRDWAAELRMETGDVAIVLLQLLSAKGWELDDVVDTRWAQVLERARQADQQYGGETP